MTETDFSFIVSTTHGMHSGTVKAIDKESAVKKIERYYRKIGSEINGMIGPYSKEELSAVDINSIKNMNQNTELNENSLRKLISECTASALNELRRELQKPKQVVSVNENQLKDIVLNGVKHVMETIDVRNTLDSMFGDQTSTKELFKSIQEGGEITTTNGETMYVPGTYSAGWFIYVLASTPNQICLGRLRNNGNQLADQNNTMSIVDIMAKRGYRQIERGQGKTDLIFVKENTV